jgi:hypothetical protein
MRHLCGVFLATGLLYGGQSLVTSTAVGTVNYPSTTPYTNVSDVRVEIRLTDLSTCRNTSGGYGNNLLRVNGVHLGCTQLNTKSLAMEHGLLPAPLIATSTQLGSVTDVTLRLQKLTALGIFLVEVWSTSTRTLLASRAVLARYIGTTYIGARKESIAGSHILLPGAAGAGTANIAWVRVYNTTVPTGSTAPRDETSCDTTSDCIARWEFEGNLAGTGFNGAALNLALANPVYATTPAYPGDAPAPGSSRTVYSISGAITPSSTAVGATLTLGGPVTKTVTADGFGNYSFVGLPNGTYSVKPAKAEVVFTPVTKTVTINGTNATANFAAAAQTWNISGAVNGSAATLTLSGTAAASTTTDATGKYSFSGLKKGSYVIAPSRSGYRFIPSTALVTINNASVSGANFTAQALPSTVTLSWAASTSLNVTGYHLYRATTTGGPYIRLTPSPVAALTYIDSGVSSGRAYFYVATAVDSNGNESTYSSEAAAMVPQS